VKQQNRINPGEQRRPVCARRIAEDANAWADKIRATQAARAPATPAPVTVKEPKK
jgi:hypothetical protein